MLVSHDRDLSIFITLTNTATDNDDYDSCDNFNDRATLTPNDGRTSLGNPDTSPKPLTITFAPEKMRSCIANI